MGPVIEELQVVEPLLPAIPGAYPVTTQYSSGIPAATYAMPATYAIQQPVATSTFAVAPTVATALPSYGMVGTAQMAPTVQYATPASVL
jgi:hypothetical protein